MSIDFLIARRYLTQKKETGFITIIMYISIAGLTIGITALLLTLGILNGFEQAITEKIQHFQAPLRIEEFNEPISNPDSLQKLIAQFQGVTGIAPFIEQVGIIRFGTLEDGVFIRGVDPELMKNVVDVNAFIKRGTFDLRESADGIPGILVGIDLADRFEIAIGDKIILAGVSEASAGVFGSPNRMIYEVHGFIESGMSEYDNLFVFTDIRQAQSLFRMPNQVTGFDIRLRSIAETDSLCSFMIKTLGYPYFVRTWRDLNRTLFDWLHVQRLPILIAFGMITLVGVVNLVSTLVLIVLEKQKDIGILKAMGASSRMIVKIFFIDGMIVYLISFVSGSGIALILKYIQNTYHIISVSKEVYFINTFPVNLQLINFFQIGFIAFILCVGATMYPAWKASRVVPAEAVRLD